MMAKEQANLQAVDKDYLPELMAEKDSIDPSFVHAARLISNEIERIKNPSGKDNSAAEQDMIDVFDTKPSRMALMMRVPVDRFPRTNFVGRLLGPGGSTLQGIQNATNTRIAILGKGSMRDKKKAEELASGGDAKYQHLNLPLHVKISSAPATVDQAHVNIGRAATEVLKLLQSVEEEGGMDAMGRGMGRGGMRGRGGRGGMGGRGGRGGGMRGGGRGAGRGGVSQRGSAGTRGRGAGGAGRGYAAKVQDPYATGQVEEYGYEGYGAEAYEGYGAEYADASYEAYGAEAYADPYAADGSYGADAAYAGDAYAYGDASYADYGNGTTDASAGQYGASKPFRGKMRGGTGRGRGSSKPY